ncbi:hypothetical protein RIF29_20804 [Crotalaria pallida]|uniref:START domain-containing protein n=1 Tax=Crotalaria pallida TaxID=3830 RepID=A0AAN9I6N2_CROPI
MEKKRKIVQYRERLDRTLASPDLTNDEMLKSLVKSQLLHSSEPEVEEGYQEKEVETKTAEVSNFLDMLRSASSDDSGRSNASHTDWKLKQDNEEFRVMYREGLEGTPFHTLLVEGFVDGPVDVCLCISWETSLYKKWWPQSIIPTFKILSCECLHKVQIGEQVSLMRVKVSWPLSMREAILHYYLFEYFQDDLIVVLTNSVPEAKSVNGTLDSLNNDAIPEAKDVVRVDLVGGFALQKVTSKRSYFRTITNMDIKLDFVPPSLINFISRQLIGNGFRLYQKAVALIMSQDKEEFSKALGDPLYARIREALYSVSGSKGTDSEELKPDARILPAEDLPESNQYGAKDVSWEDENIQYANNVTSMVLDNSKAFGEIVEADTEEIVQSEENVERVNDIPIEEVNPSVPKGKRSVYISSEVEQALDTLDKAISVVRQYRLRSDKASYTFPNRDPPYLKKLGRDDSYLAKHIHLGSKDEVTVALYSLENGAILEQANKQVNTDSVQDICSDDRNKSSWQKKINTIVTQGMSSDVSKKSSRQKKYLNCCFLN